jgi:diguanylate cyclase (GGDEF)-like protein/PAS domain S-box-containing protein
VRSEIASKAACFIYCWLRRHGFALRLAGCFFSVVLASVFVGLAPEANFIWVANGVLLAYLLLAPRKRWPAYLCSAYVAQLIGGLLAGHHGIVAGLFLTFLNVAESLVSALLLRRRSSDLPDFTSPAYVAKFLAFGVFAGPIATGAVAALVSPLWHTGSPLWRDPSPGAEFLQWVAADALGACVVTPACVAIFRTRFRDSLFSLKHWAHLLPVVALAFAIFQYARVPLAFLLYPLLVIVLLRLGLGWAALATLFVAGVASFFTVRGQGPFAASVPTTHLESAILVQLYIASAMIILYSVSVVLEDLRATERRLQEIAALHKLVTENSRDVIIIADFEGNRSYISSSASNWGGYTHQEMLMSKSIDIVHPEDKPKVAGVLKQLRASADGVLVECRVKRKDGSYVWIESNLRMIRDPITGIPTGIINNAREITEHKLAEQQLADAYHTVEALAVTDALTGLANRRRFDQCLITEWRRAMRDRKPLSLLLIDADFFKSYNDAYGHLRGDSCLKQIAEAAQDVVARPGDLVARFGGEEFAVILPDTDSSGALQLAHDICAVMRNRQLPHSSNPAGVVTVSVGCATLNPQLGKHAATLIDHADKALYQAKRTGRNRACTYQPDAETDAAGEESGSLVAVKLA